MTIRKRFVKETDLSNVTLVPREDTESNAVRENLILKEKCKSLEIDIGFRRIDKENL